MSRSQTKKKAPAPAKKGGSGNPAKYMTTNLISFLSFYHYVNTKPALKAMEVLNGYT